MASILDTIKKLKKEFKNDNLIITGDLLPNIEKLSTQALGMDYPLFGGLPYKNICVYSGLPHSGKTTAACCELAAYQKAHPDRPCVYIDAEHRLNTEFQTKMNHIDWSKVQVVNIPTGMSGEQVLDLIVELGGEIHGIGRSFSRQLIAKRLDLVQCAAGGIAVHLLQEQDIRVFFPYGICHLLQVLLNAFAG